MKETKGYISKNGFVVGHQLQKIKGFKKIGGLDCPLDIHITATEDQLKNGRVTIIVNRKINKELYESEKPFVLDYYYTEEQLDQLRYLIDIAEPDTQTRQVIFDMMMEEMDPYLNGNKDLDSACEILDSRVRLYLQERR